MRVGLVVLATGRYTQFVPPLIYSARQFFFPGKASYFVLTDADVELVADTSQHRVSHDSWPKSTLLRYRKALSIRQELAQCDYIFQCDADMRFAGHVGTEILGDRVATLHPGYWQAQPHQLPHETNQESTAYVRPEMRTHYYAGGFVGGTSVEYLLMAEGISRAIDADLSRGLVAKWHDESHLQAYLRWNPPTKILTPAYCYPESWGLPFPKKLLALEKNHAEMRA